MAVLKIGRPSGSVPVGLIGLTLVTTGSALPRTYETPTLIAYLSPRARSNWTLFCHVRATSKPGIDRPQQVRLGAGAGAQDVGKRRRAGGGRLKRRRRAAVGAVIEQRLFVGGEQRLVVHQAGVGANHRALVGAERPRQPQARPPVVLVDLEIARGGERRGRVRVGHVEHVVADAVQQLDVGRQPPVVLDEEAVEVGAVLEIRVAEELRERRVRERVGAVAGGQVIRDAGERVELRRGLRARVLHVLDVAAELERVIAAQQRERVVDLEDVLGEAEARVGAGSRSVRRNSPRPKW